MRIIHLPGRPISESFLKELGSGPFVLSARDRAVEAALKDAGVVFRVAQGIAEPGEVLLIPTRPMDELALIVDRLLGPGGCPWDQAQTHESLKKYLLEEAYEVFDAIDSGALDKLREELGDLLLQPVLHAQMEALRGSFTIDDVARAISEKLIRRHPHVFGDVKVEDEAEVLRNWDRIKQSETEGAPKSILAGVPLGMAALLRAHEVSKRAVRVGFEWETLDAVFAKLDEELEELKEAIASGSEAAIEGELGDLLFTIVNVARRLKIEPEEALRKMLNRFTQRFQFMESKANKPLVDLSAEEWDSLWKEAKLPRTDSD